MVFSMTGFAGKTVSFTLNKNEKISLDLELKTINSRYFECSCRLPDILSSLEVNIINLLKSKLIRGRVFIGARILDNKSNFAKVVPSLSLVEEYLDATKIIKDKFKVSGQVTISDILHLPNIFAFQNVEIDGKISKLVIDAFDDLAIQLNKSRALEGAELKKDLEKRFIICNKKIAEIEKRFKVFVKKLKNEIQKKLIEYKKNTDESVKLKLDELYSVLNKIDVNEEIVRFKSHLKNVKNILNDEAVEKGKRLDFTLQELLRESNTILAKCSDFSISKFAVDIKVELEKVREQSQNIV